MSLTLVAVVMALSGVPRPSQIKWCLLPVFLRSTGGGPVLVLPFRPDLRTVHTCAGPVKFACGVQFSEQDPMQPVKHPRPLPLLQAPPAGLAGAEPQLRGRWLAGDVVVTGRRGRPGGIARQVPAEGPERAPATPENNGSTRAHRAPSKAACSCHTNDRIITPVRPGRHFL